MSRKPKRIRVSSDSELALILRESARDGEPLVFDTGGKAYSLVVTSNKIANASIKAVGSGHPPTAEEVERSKEGILKAAGSWKGVDAEAFKAYIASRRRSARRPSVRL